MLALGRTVVGDWNGTFRDHTVIELVGDVGAGKTTFVRGLAKALGVKEPVTSPSFTISKSYALPDGKTLVHYDFYRLNDPGLMQEDLKEKLKENNIIVIEWGNSIEKILPAERTIISFSKNDDGSREVIIKNNRESTIEGLSEPGKARLSAISSVATEEIDAARNGTLRLFLDTSSPVTILKLNNQIYEWNSGRDLAEKLLGFIYDKLTENNQSWNDISEIVFMSGPGSFAGLRIGAAVVNTLAHELKIPLYDHHGQKHQIIIPEYGRDANITKPVK